MAFLKKPIVFTYLDKQRSRKKDNLYPVRMIVKSEGKRAIYGLNIFMSEEDYQFVRTSSVSMIKKRYKVIQNQEELLDQKAIIEGSIKKAQAIIDTLEVFSFEVFRNKFFSLDTSTIVQALEAKYQQLMKEGRAGYASSFLCTQKSIISFLGGKKTKKEGKANILYELDIQKDVPLKEIDKKFLEKYQEWFLNQPGRRSKTSAGIYIRNIRVIMYDAVAAGHIEKDAIPFGNRQYKIPKSKARKLALTAEEFSQLQNAELIPGSSEDKYRDYFLFSFWAHGMNLKDIARLKYENLVNGRIEYVRAKTELKEVENEEPLHPTLNKTLISIIDKWGSRPVLPGSFIFPIIEPGLTAKQERDRVVNENSALNRALKRVLSQIGLTKQVSFYTARHTWASILNDRQIPLDIISKKLGHSSVTTTKGYIATLSNSADELIESTLNDLQPNLPEIPRELNLP